MKELETAKWVWLRFDKANIQRATLIMSLGLNVFLCYVIIQEKKSNNQGRKELTKYFDIIVQDKRDIEEEVRELKKKLKKP